MDSKIIVTKDNSKTLLISELNETYHSTNGAVTESKHVFIQEGLSHLNLKEMNIFEMGFGTGLNALLSLAYSDQHKCKINYDTIEAYPLSYSTICEIGYIEDLKFQKFGQQFKLMHESQSTESIQIDERFLFQKIIGRMEEHVINNNHYDIIYYDAFSPNVNPDLWTEKIMLKLFNSLKTNGILVTYCAQGKFKRVLKSVGFKLESIAGPPGKREISRAVKNVN